MMCQAKLWVHPIQTQGERVPISVNPPSVQKLEALAPGRLNPHKLLQT